MQGGFAKGRMENGQDPARDLLCIAKETPRKSKKDFTLPRVQGRFLIHSTNSHFGLAGGSDIEKMHLFSCRWGGFSEFGPAKAFGGKTEGCARQNENY